VTAVFVLTASFSISLVAMVAALVWMVRRSRR
jgi:hypothetical protein